MMGQNHAIVTLAENADYSLHITQAGSIKVTIDRIEEGYEVFVTDGEKAICAF